MAMLELLFITVTRLLTGAVVQNRGFVFEPPVQRMFGSTSPEARVVVRAVADAWVQIQDAESNLLLTRVLRAGDGYRVPDRRGVTMRTGNAGGLEIFVDGKVVAPVGPIGGVRRNVALDPERLVAGTAVPE